VSLTPPVPGREETDLWLFLAQHFGVPTRLLDWTQGALIALYFALLEEKADKPRPIVWMLNPTQLNRKSAPDVVECVFPLTWVSPEHVVNIGSVNIRYAWELQSV